MPAVASEKVLYEVDGRGVATLTLDDPDTRNALSAEQQSGVSLKA